MAEVKDVYQVIEKYQKAVTKHELVYDSSTETLEPVYFWLIDLMKDFGLKVKKLTDNFTSSAGSGHFSEFGQKKSMMQQQATQMMGNVNTVLRSVLNLVYDLKEFKVLLQSYDDLKSEDENRRKAARLSLKQRWMDKVDIQKGNSSIKAMALGQAGFQTLLDAFLAADSLEDAKKLDLNERVKRILYARIPEFEVWLKESEKELRKRFELEKTYLRSQVNSLKLYAKWVRPYMKASSELEQKEQGTNVDLVNAFNSIILQLTVLGYSEIKPESGYDKGKIPADTKPLNFKRSFYKVALVDFYFRGIPSRLPQGGYSQGGKVTITFRGYALNEDELDKIYKDLEKNELSEMLGLVQGATDESLAHLEEEINSFLQDKDTEKEETKEKKKQGNNPFLALIGYYNEKEEKKESKDNKDKSKEIKPDTWAEKELLRPFVEAEAKDTAFSLFDVYKKAHQMMSYT